MTKADPGTVGVKAVIEFTKEGKMKVEDGDRKLEGTYKVDGDKFTFSIKVEGGKFIAPNGSQQACL